MSKINLNVEDMMTLGYKNENELEDINLAKLIKQFNRQKKVLGKLKDETIRERLLMDLNNAFDNAKKSLAKNKNKLKSINKEDEFEKYIPSLNRLGEKMKTYKSLHELTPISKIIPIPEEMLEQDMVVPAEALDIHSFNSEGVYLPGSKEHYDRLMYFDGNRYVTITLREPGEDIG